jgi:hypothetical protein
MFSWKTEDPQILKDLKKPDYFFVSHDVFEINGIKDLYFGSLNQNLIDIGKKVVTVYIPHNQSKGSVKTGLPNVYFLRKKLGKVEVINYLFKNYISIIQLIKYCMKNRYSLYEALVIVNGQLRNFGNLKLTRNITYFIDFLKPLNIIVTFEGTAIERSVFSVGNSRNIRTIGYQHAPIIKDQHSIFSDLGNGLNPTVILTSGPYTAHKFRKKLGGDRTIGVIGSPKFKNFSQNNISFNSPLNLLLIPDGNNESLLKFLKLGSHLIMHKEFWEIRIRSHPLFHGYLIEQFKTLGLNPDLPFKFSNSTLDEDLLSADWVIYQNSSVCIQGLLQNCGLIYFENQLANVNPLYDQPSLYFAAKNVNDILTIISHQKRQSPLDNFSSWKFASEYFSQLDLNSFLKLTD